MGLKLAAMSLLPRKVDLKTRRGRKVRLDVKTRGQWGKMIRDCAVNYLGFARQLNVHLDGVIKGEESDRG